MGICKNTSFAEQLFHSLAAVNFKAAAQLRPLTPAERSSLEQAEAKAGPMLSQLEAEIGKIKKGHHGIQG